MKYISKKNFLLLIGLCVTLFFGQAASASSYLEKFDDITGSLCDDSNWSCNGTYTESINSNDYTTPNNQLTFSTNNSLSTNYIQWDVIDSPTLENWFFNLKKDIDASDVFVLAFFNTADTIHTFFSIEGDGSLTINGSDTTQDIPDEIYTEIYIEIDKDNDRARGKINGGSYTTYKNYGVTNNDTAYIRIYSNNVNIDVDTFYNIAGQADLYATSTDWTGDWFNLNDTLPDYYTAISDVCFINETCNVVLYYNDQAIGKQIYFIYDNGQDVFPVNAELDFTIPTTYNNEYIFNPTTATTTQSQDYCLYLEDSVNGDKLQCGMTIHWYDRDIYVDDIITQNWCAEENVCEGVATSSDFLYGFQCGARKTLCWAFAPTPNSLDTFKSSTEKFRNSFPFNLTFSLIDAVDESISTSTTGANIGLPMLSTTTEEYYMLEGFNDTWWDDKFGTSTMAQWETYADYICYGLFALFIAFIIYRNSLT